MKKSILGVLISAAVFAAYGDVTLPNTSTIADIQAAIDAAQPGDTITLADGTYTFNEPLTVNKGITLTGSHRDRCLLVGSDSVKLDSALTIDAVGACVRNLTVSNILSDTWYNYYAVGVRIKSGLLTQSRVTGCRTTAGNRTAGVSLESTVGGQTDAAFMTHCMIDHNSATGANDIGGVMFMNNKNGGSMFNCLVWANSGYNAGGVGIISPSAWQPVKIVNCTIVGNSASKHGGGLTHGADYISANAGPWVVNTIISGNSAPEGGDIYFNKDDSKNLTGYNCLCPSVSYGVNPQTSDPGFVDDENGDFRLQPASKARNRGDMVKAASVLGLESLSGLTDFYGVQRVLEDEVDIGCAEFMVDPNQPTCVISSDRDSLVAGDDVTLTAVVDGFGDAEDIEYAWQVRRADSAAETMSGASVLLKALEFGSYTAKATASSPSLGKSAESADFAFLVLPKTLYVTSKENPTSAAPYGTPETAATSVQDALAIAVEGATVVLDEGTHQVSDTVVVAKGVSVMGAGREKTTLYASAAFDPVVRINGAGAQVSGVTVSHGRMKNWWNQSASGVVIGSDGGTLADCRVTDCGGEVSRIFGSVNISGSEALVTRCLIDGNFSRGGGSTCGGIVASAGRIEHCVITNNEGFASAYMLDHNGSGLCLKGPVTVLNCTIMGNRMSEGHEGSGVHVMSSGARVHNCIISGNLSGDGTESNYLGNGSSFSYCLSSSAAPSGSVECIVGTPVFKGSRPLCLDRSSPGRSQGSVVGYEELLTAKDFFGNRRVKRVTSKGVADIDIGAVESGYVGGMMIFVR